MRPEGRGGARFWAVKPRCPARAGAAPATQALIARRQTAAQKARQSARARRRRVGNLLQSQAVGGAPQRSRTVLRLAANLDANMAVSPYKADSPHLPASNPPWPRTMALATPPMFPEFR